MTIVEEEDEEEKVKEIVEVEEKTPEVVKEEPVKAPVETKTEEESKPKEEPVKEAEPETAEFAVLNIEETESEDEDEEVPQKEEPATQVFDVEDFVQSKTVEIPETKSEEVTPEKEEPESVEEEPTPEVNEDDLLDEIEDLGDLKAQIENLKAEAKTEVSFGRYENAVKVYERAIKAVEARQSRFVLKSDGVFVIKASLWNNIAYCHKQSHDSIGEIEYAGKVIEATEQLTRAGEAKMVVKALIRRA